jgi:hypothetical protein
MARGWAGRKRSRCLVGRSQRTIRKVSILARPEARVSEDVRFTYIPVAGHVADLPAGGIWRARVSGGSADLALLNTIGRGAEDCGGQCKSGDDDLHHFDGLMLYGNRVRFCGNGSLS